MSYGRPPPDVDGMHTLKVDNLTYRTSPEMLRRSFEKYGDVGDVYIPRDRFTRESRGFAFVRFYDKRDAEDAMDAMDGKMLDGRELRVQVARYSRPADPYFQRRAAPRRTHGSSSSGRRRKSYSRSSSRSRSHSRSRSRDRKDRRRRRSKSRSRSRSKSDSKSRSRSPAKQHRKRTSKSPSKSRSKSKSKTRSRSKSKQRSRSGSKSPRRSASPRNHGENGNKSDMGKEDES
ncbi:serine/arginine-rich splicing factor 2 isoform X2 [Lethenteron reissneri]|uniref:serine/arginine-rich splicing factor 2 isoform X2 n=1 Tax=Lethenteron reissneri TaxID=7753 RepID=UPI002AB6F773|nr:serine/arginine-rich splicing factor 2 isoform X2 [Lethenteron reissneri]